MTTLQTLHPKSMDSHSSKGCKQDETLLFLKQYRCDNSIQPKMSTNYNTNPTLNSILNPLNQFLIYHYVSWKKQVESNTNNLSNKISKRTRDKNVLNHFLIVTKEHFLFSVQSCFARLSFCQQYLSPYKPFKEPRFQYYMQVPNMFLKESSITIAHLHRSTLKTKLIEKSKNQLKFLL